MKVYLGLAAAVVFFLLFSTVMQKRPRLAITLVFVPLTAWMLYVWMFQIAPKESDLRVVRGRIETVTQKDWGIGGTAFRLHGCGDEFLYRDSYPRPDQIRQALQSGAEVTVWTSGLDLKRWDGPHIWRLDKDAKTVVSFTELSAAIRRERRGALYGVCFFGAISLIGISPIFARKKGPARREPADGRPDEPAAIRDQGAGVDT
jgi:hypothetical protein